MSEEKAIGRGLGTRWLCVLAVLACMLGVAACSSSSSGGSSTTSPPAGGSSGSGSAATTGSAASTDPVAEANAAVAKLSSPGSMTFPGPTTPVKPGSHNVAVIAAGLSGQGAKSVAPYLDEAIKAAGWTTPSTFDGKFDATVQSGLIQQAVQSKYAGIFLIAITPSSVATAVNVATAAKIPVVCVNCGPDPDASSVPGVIHSDPGSLAVGTAQAQVAMSLTDGKGKIAVFTDAEFGQTVAQTQASEAYLKKNCSGCSVTAVKMTVADATAPGVPLFTAFLASHPAGSIDVVIAPYDTAAAPFATAAEQAGRTEIKFVSFGGLQPFYQQLLAKSPAGSYATTAAPVPYESWAAVDLMARTLANQPLWNASELPVELITTANAAKFDKTNPYAQPSSDFRAMFKKYWGTGS